MHKQGHSLREISSTLSISKTTAIESLQKQGVSTDARSLRQRGLRVGAAPYGYVMVQGKLDPDPKEQKIVKVIMAKWRLGKSLNAIARELNAKGVPPRSGKPRDHSTIGSIITRHKDK